MQKLTFICFTSLLLWGTGCSSSREAGNNKTLEAARYDTRLPDSLLRKQNNGIDLFAKGSTPVNWSLEMDFDQGYHFKSSDNNSLDVLPTKPVQNGNSSTYRSGEMSIVIYNEACQGASPNDKRIELSVRGKQYSGCSKYLYDYRINERWHLEKINNNAVSSAMFTKGLPTLELNLADHTMKGTDGCNNISSGLEVMGSKLRFNHMISTRMACREDLFASIVAKQFSDQLIDYYIRDGKLVLYLQDDSMLVYGK